ncbi:MAG: DUF190 domain-containing protein [Actinophytocola sp.]|nr:DUF190 domain-containing protein [Actinophytocola sp.]
MTSTERAMRLTIHVSENDTWQHKPLYHEIVRRAREAGLAGASVFRGIEGYGSHSLIHTTRFLSLSEDLPLAIVIVDDEQRVRAFADELSDVLSDGLVTLDEVEIVRYPGEAR